MSFKLASVTAPWRNLIIIAFGMLLTTTLLFYVSRKVIVNKPIMVPANDRSLFEVASVLGSAKCGDYDLAKMIADKANAKGVPPALAAAIVAIESRCNSLAISPKNCIGLMQINLSAWNSTYDFSKINLFNKSDNIDTGLDILRKNMEGHTIRQSILLYNNDPAYVDQVMSLSGLEVKKKSAKQENK